MKNIFLAQGTMYRKGGRTFAKAIGSRAEVMHATAHHTAGGLTTTHLKYNKHGRIVSKKKSEHGKKHGLKRLARAGYAPFKKGSTAVRLLR
jgi:DVNP family